MSVRCFSLAIALAGVTLLAACSSTVVPAGADSGSPESGSKPESGGTPGCSPPPGAAGKGSTLGGCPADEPAAGAACSIMGRLCTWTRDCPTAHTTDTGWCTAGGVWQIAAGQCQAGCPADSMGAQSFCGQGNSSCNPCKPVGLTCLYPTTPISPGFACTCSGTWPTPGGCMNYDACWTPAPGSTTPKSCSELEPCGGSVGCGGSCPSPNQKTCGCGPDGHLYCQVGPPC
jgi:hypothetical protein